MPSTSIYSPLLGENLIYICLYIYRYIIYVKKRVAAAVNPSSTSLLIYLSQLSPTTFSYNFLLHLSPTTFSYNFLLQLSFTSFPSPAYLHQLSLTSFSNF